MISVSESFGAEMGKTLYLPALAILEDGKHYLAASCPETGGTLCIEEVPQGYQIPPGDHLISCPFCHAHHIFQRQDLSVIDGKTAAQQTS